MSKTGYTCQQVIHITGLSQRQLSYWRKTGLVIPKQRTAGGHARYSFADLLTLKTARKLIDAGVSVQRIRKSITSLTDFLPTCNIPLTELSLVATGDMILVLHQETAFKALTGQEWIYSVAELEREAAISRGVVEPEQKELFTTPESIHKNVTPNQKSLGVTHKSSKNIMDFHYVENNP